MTTVSKESGFKNFVRGGQTVLHNIRMFNQIMRKVFWISFLLLLGFVGFWFWIKTSPYERYIFGSWIYGHFLTLFDGSATQNFQLPDGSVGLVKSTDLLVTPYIQETMTHIRDILIFGISIGFLIYTVISTGLIYWLKGRGKKYTENKRLKGDYLESGEVVKKLILQKQLDSWVVLSKIRLSIPKYSLNQHFFFHGTTGSGKSTAIKELLDLIRAQGDRAIIYDKGCVLTEAFYRPKIDHLMNPLDERTANWNLWKECRDKAEFESFAAAQIPMMGSQDPFWVNAARTIFSAAANRMRKEVKDPKLLPLLKYLLTAELGDVQNLLRGTEAESLMSEKIEKTAISIKSVLATYLKSLCYVKEGDHAFSIREWVASTEKTGWLFFSSTGDKHETLKPLITAWLDLAINTLISLPESQNRRIWIILDEATSLHKIPKITDGLSEARKFGGCFVIGIQNFAKLRETYGSEGAKDISSLLNTRFLFRQPDPEMAEWGAKNLGETIIEEVNESISYGANTIRDGVSIHRNEKRKPVATASEMMSLADLECYVRLAGQYPITKLYFDYKHRPKANEPFMPRDIQQDDLRGEVESLIEQFQQGEPEEKRERPQSSFPHQKKSESTVELKAEFDDF